MSPPTLERLLPEPRGPVEAEEAYGRPPPAPGRSTHLRANFVTSLDGAAALEGHSEGLSSPADKAIFASLRGLCDVILVGAGTLRQEGYGPAEPRARRQARRRSMGLAPVPPIAVVTRSLQVDLDSPFFAEATVPPVVLTTEAAPPERRAEAARRCDLVVVGRHSVDLRAALEALGRRGLVQVLCEGGPTLMGELMALDLVDELCLSLSPLVVGRSGSLGLLAGAPDSPAWPVGMDLVQVLTDTQMLFLRYQRRRADTA